MLELRISSDKLQPMKIVSDLTSQKRHELRPQTTQGVLWKKHELTLPGSPMLHYTN